MPILEKLPTPIKKIALKHISKKYITKSLGNTNKNFSYT